jgi:hypothetical protein
MAGEDGRRELLGDHVGIGQQDDRRIGVGASGGDTTSGKASTASLRDDGPLG